MPQIKKIPKMTVAYVTNKGPYADAVGRGFQQLFGWLEENRIQPAGKSLAIFYDDPSKVAAEKLKSESCVPISQRLAGSGDVGVKEVGGVEAATSEYRGTDNIMRTYDELYGWLHAQGYRDNGAPMETYLSQLGEELHAEIAVPVTKMKSAAPKNKTRPKRPTTPRKKSSKKKAKG